MLSNILIVDDNKEVLLALKMYLSKHFPDIETISNPESIPSIIEIKDYDVIILDMNFTAGVNNCNEGIYWMKRILESDPDASIIFLTAYGNIELAVRTLKEGATDFIEKPWDNEKILATITSAIKLKKSKSEIKSLKNKQKKLNSDISESFKMFVGESAAMQKIVSIIQKASKTDANILILGENGTGKEILAREIHKQSNRANDIFVSVDISSFPASLIESELFGHVKGSFTGANNDRVGRFEIASGGTLFLDEIGNLPGEQQAKLLTVLQNREIFKIGSNKVIPVDIRLISATNMPLFEMINQSKFREDLLYRINTIQIELPPLRERKEDIPALTNYFLEKYKTKYLKDDLKIYPNVIDLLLKHNWPGNIREFEHTIEKALILCNDDVIKIDDIQINQSLNPIIQKTKSFNLDMNEKRIVIEALKKYNYNISETAIELGITRATLYRKMKKHGI